MASQRQAAVPREADLERDVTVRARREQDALAQPQQPLDDVGPRIEAVPGEGHAVAVVGVTTSSEKWWSTLVERLAVQHVQRRPGPRAAAHGLHLRVVAATPRVGERTPVDGRLAVAADDGLGVPCDAGPPVDARAEHVEEERLHRHRGASIRQAPSVSAARAPHSPPASLQHARVLPSRDDLRAALPRAAQTAISAAVAWQICRWLGADRPVFAAIVPIVAIKGDPLAALNVSLGRLFGVVGGIALGIVVADVGGANAVTVALLIGAGLIAGLLIRIGGEPNSQVAVSALLVLAVATGAGAFGLERLWETAIGAAVTVILAPFLWPPDPVRELERRLAAVAGRVADDIALTLALVGASADAAAGHLEDVVEHTREATRLVDALGTAGRGLRLNPRRRGDRRAAGAARAAGADRGRRRARVAPLGA